MSIKHHEDWNLSEKGKNDAARHRSKIEDAIRKGAIDVIAEESIISKKRDGNVKIPVKGLKDYRFKYGRVNDEQAGVGQGKHKPGDVIYRRKIDDGSGGAGGHGKGEDYMEVEVDIDYLLQILFEELGLPFIEEKTKIEQLIPTGFKFDYINKKGILPLLHKKRTIQETIKRTSQEIIPIIHATGCDPDIAARAFIQSNYDMGLAVMLIKKNKVDMNIDPSDLLIVSNDDRRFRQIDENVEPQSKAVVIFGGDSSGSMTKEKKFLLRSTFFWIAEFLRKRYNHVDIRFIIHTTEAQLVDEDVFFRQGESGGTLCHTCVDKATDLFESDYPFEEYNRYFIYSGDGEDFQPEKTVDSIRRMFDKGVNMMGYCEVESNVETYHYSDIPLLLGILKEEFYMKKMKTDIEFYINFEMPLLAGKIQKREDIWPFIRSLLFTNRKD
jgi:uncharacterized protein